MKRLMLAVLCIFMFNGTGFAATSPDVAGPIGRCIDAFNVGDMKSFYAAYAVGEITIVDEFAPHRWTGPNAAHEWVADYGKHAEATGVTDGNVKHDAPTRTEIEGDLAYVIVPTVYFYKQNGKPTAEEGQMTFVLHSEAGGWKVRGWTWTGGKPHPAK